MLKFSYLIHTFIRKKDVENSFKVLEDLIENGMQPNDLVLGTLLKGMFLLGEMEKVEEVKEIIKNHNFLNTPQIKLILDTHRMVDKKY
jgi:pentatricopeptide repeat protein